MYQKSWKKKICSLVLSIAVIGSISVTAGAQQSTSLRRGVAEVSAYQQTTAVQGTTSQKYVSVLAMSANEVQAENAIAKALMNGDSRLSLIQYRITQDQLIRILNYTNFTNYPQIASVISYEYTMDEQDIIYGLWPKYDVSQAEVAARTAKIEQAAQAVLSSIITKDMTTLQKIVAVHDYLVLNCSYDNRVDLNTTPHDSFTAYGVLVNKVAVCQGYAATFQLMMQKLGIPSVVVQSTAMNHAWNMVQYDGNWYHVDATWDDPVPDRPGVVQSYALMQSDQGIMGGENKHYSWDSAGYSAVNTQFDNNFDWSPYRVSVVAAKSA